MMLMWMSEFVYLLYVWYLRHVSWLLTPGYLAEDLHQFHAARLLYVLLHKFITPDFVLKAGESGTSKEKWRVRACSSHPGVTVRAAFPTISPLLRLARE